MSSSAVISEGVRVALVSGANKGIGLGLVRHLYTARPHLHILLGSRNLARGQAALRELQELNEFDDVSHRVHVVQLDVCDQKSVDDAAAYIREKFGGLDILVNNAGMAFKGDAFSSDVFRETADTNFLGVLRMMQTMMPLMRPHGRVVNVSSRAGRLNKVGDELRKRFLAEDLSIDSLKALMEEYATSIDAGDFKEKGWPSNTYSVSKIGCSMLTRIFARDFTRDNILINCCCPGWVRTDMAGPRATLSIDEGVVTPLKLCFINDDAPNGRFWYDEKAQDWI